MGTLKFLSALTFITTLTYPYGHAMEEIKKLDHTWNQDDRIKFNLTYNNVIGLDAESPSSCHNSLYTPYVCVIDDMKEHGKHICSTIAETSPKAKILEVNYKGFDLNNPTTRFKTAATCSIIDIINLSFGANYLTKIFSYDKLFITYSEVLTGFINTFISDNVHLTLSKNDNINLGKCFEIQRQEIDIMMKNITDAPFLVNNCVSLEQLSKSTYNFLNNDLQIDAKYTQGLSDFIRVLDAFELIPYMVPSCPMYESILEAAKKGKIIVRAFGNEHNIISSGFENEYANRLNALAKLINENPDIPGRFIIVGNSQYSNSSETLNPTSTRSNIKQPYVVTAPGTNITARVGETGYKIKSGTSMAAPAVDGVIARLLCEYKAKYENAGIKDMNSIRGIIADHVIKETRKTNFFTQELLPNEFGQGVLNYGLAKEAIEKDLSLINYENKLKEIYETKLFSMYLQNELERRIEIRELTEQVYKLETKIMENEHKNLIITEMRVLEEIRGELELIYKKLNMM